MNESLVGIVGLDDTLSKEYLALALRKEIPDVNEYHRDWIRLAWRARCQGRIALASMCFTRASYYGKQLPGSYRREFPNKHTSVLIQTEARF